MGFVSIDIQCASGLFRTPKSEPGTSEALSNPCCDPHGWIFQWGAALNTLKVFKYSSAYMGMKLLKSLGQVQDPSGLKAELCGGRVGGKEFLPWTFQHTLYR